MPFDILLLLVFLNQGWMRGRFQRFLVMPKLLLHFCYVLYVLEEIRGLSDDVQVLSKAPNASGSVLPILVEKRLGQGKLIYLASCFTEQSAEMLLAYTGEISPYQELFSLPKETELAVRICGDTKYLFVLNYHAHSVQVELHREMKELLSGENEVGMVTLPGYGVRVYEWHG